MTTNSYGVTVEDLEKAASVRLFEKAANAEGINLAALTEDQVDNLYAAYQTQEENTMDQDIIDLFEKQAAYEGVDLGALSDEELAYVYNNFIENIGDEDEGYHEDDEDEAYEKLAEAEILGRHMARAYMDELGDGSYDDDHEKLARAAWKEQMGLSGGKGVGANPRGRAGRIAAMKKTQAKERTAYLAKREKRLGPAYAKKRGQTLGQKLKRLGGKSRAELNAAAGSMSKKEMRQAKLDRMKYHGGEKMKQLSAWAKANPKKALLAGGGALAAGAAGSAYAGSKMSKSASDVAFEEIVGDRAYDFVEFGKEAGFDGSPLDISAAELLEALGYDTEELYY